MSELLWSDLLLALEYDPESGAFTRRVRAGAAKAGDVAGSLRKNGYLSIGLFGRDYLAHRLAWFYMLGRWPAGEVDHINGLKADNRLANLRDVPRAMNAQNVRKPKRGNQSGFLGVCPHQGRWCAQITVNRKRFYLGMFDTPQDAHEVYLMAKRDLHEGGTL